MTENSPWRMVGDRFRESAELLHRFAEEHTEEIYETAMRMSRSIAAGGKLLICGNGGSAADAQHFAAEMIGRLTRERRAIPALSLTTDTSILTAVANDYSIAQVFRRQVEGLGQSEDVLVAISTSGNSENVVQAVLAAKEKGMQVIGLLGRDGGRLAPLSDAAIIVPADNPQRIQEVHIAVIHAWCELIENELYPNSSKSRP
ncbi:MAG: D-sedoheptulose 7-phosphate isomerase [candidate division KSB1 bacterium]|nr:D-sedoheptulose 7-phosphate isomerase [candidate division KSB1 bacterium]